MLSRDAGHSAANPCSASMPSSFTAIGDAQSKPPSVDRLSATSPAWPAPRCCMNCTHSAPSAVWAMCGVFAQFAISVLPTTIVRGALCQWPLSAIATNWSALRRPSMRLIQLSSRRPSGVVAKSGWAEPTLAGSGHSATA